VVGKESAEVSAIADRTETKSIKPSEVSGDTTTSKRFEEISPVVAEGRVSDGSRSEARALKRKVTQSQRSMTQTKRKSNINPTKKKKRK